MVRRDSTRKGFSFFLALGLVFLTVPSALAAPSITSFSPTSGALGSTVTITGSGFGSTQGTVTFTNSVTASVSSWSDQSISVTVPLQAQTGTIKVTSSGQSATSSSSYTVSPPSITSLNPNSGAIGSTVTITGTNFYSVTPSENVVKFNGVTATVSSGSSTSLTVTVPTGASSGEVVVTTGNYTSSSNPTFSVTGVTDTTPPTVSSTSPSNGATSVFPSVVTAIFSEEMTSSSIGTSTFTISAGGSNVSGTVSYDSTTRTVGFRPSGSWSGNTTYTATITTGVKDSAGNNMAANYIWTFTTQQTVETTLPTLSQGATLVFASLLLMAGILFLRRRKA